MSLSFLVGMHLVKSIDEAVAVQLFNEISDFSAKVRKTSDNWAIDEYDYISSNINEEMKAEYLKHGLNIEFY